MDMQHPGTHLASLFVLQLSERSKSFCVHKLRDQMLGQMIDASQIQTKAGDSIIDANNRSTPDRYCFQNVVTRTYSALSLSRPVVREESWTWSFLLWWV